MIYDVAIVGAGPAGISAAEQLAAKNKRVILFEKNKLGGVNIHEGCIPAKTLFHNAYVWDSVHQLDTFGIHMKEAPTFSYKEIVQRKDQIIHALEKGIADKMKLAGIEVVNAFAKLDGEDDTGNIKLIANNINYKAKRVILTGGSENFVPPIEGIEHSNFLDAKDVLELGEIPKSLTVIGGGVLGIEFAVHFASFGSKVDVIERSDEILPSMDKELSGILRKEFEKKGVTFHLNSTVVRVEGKTVVILENGKERTLTNDEMLLATGRIPLTEKLNVESLGIETNERKAIIVNKSMQTSHPRVYACGDIIGGAMLVHVAVHESNVAVAHMLGREEKIDYNLVPGVVYTNPEIAAVGAHEWLLEERGIKYKAISVPLSLSDRYVLQNGVTAVGQMKILVGEDDKILGVHILGNPASELIVIASMAIAEGYTIEKLKRVIFPHPSVGRVFYNALE